MFCLFSGLFAASYRKKTSVRNKMKMKLNEKIVEKKLFEKKIFKNFFEVLSD
jgi:hypothetical protein